MPSFPTKRRQKRSPPQQLLKRRLSIVEVAVVVVVAVGVEVAVEVAVATF